MKPIPPAERILLVALDNLGDLVFASALTPPLHERFPNAEIDVWCKAYTTDIAWLIPHVSEVVAADPFWTASPGRPRQGVRSFLRSVRTVRRRRYDIAVLSEAPWRVAAAVAASRIPVRIGSARRRNSFFLTHRVPAQDEHKPVLVEQARLLAPLGIESPNPRYRLDATPLAALKATMAKELPDQFMAFHPFAGARDRCIPLTEWTQLAFALQSRGVSVLWIGTADELTELRTSYTQPRGFYVDQLESADPSLSASAAAISLASLFVGHDSGPLHVAGALGVPVIGLFAPGQPDRTFPQGVGPSRIIVGNTPEDITIGMILEQIDALSARA